LFFDDFLNFILKCTNQEIEHRYESSCDKIETLDFVR